MTKISLCLILFNLLLFSCTEKEKLHEVTSRTISYQFNKGYYLDQETSGSVTIKEQPDHTLYIEISLDGTLDGAEHLAHLHYGSLDNQGEMAAMLEPVKDIGHHKSRSITILQYLEDGSVMDFDRLINFDDSIKVHFASTGELKNVILGSADIGSNSDVNRNRIEIQFLKCIPLFK